MEVELNLDQVPQFVDNATVQDKSGCNKDFSQFSKRVVPAEVKEVLSKTFVIHVAAVDC